MSVVTREIVDMVEMLPEDEQTLAYEFVKRLVLAWDSDFTRLTPEERRRLESAKAEFKRGEYVGYDDVNWK